MLKLFVSYAHNDEDFVKHFFTYMAPLTHGDNPLLKNWNDRCVTSGEKFWNEIDHHLIESDIICLFLSKDYLCSTSCIKEMKMAIKRQKDVGILVIPVVLSTCRWLDADSELKQYLAATTDAKPINSFPNEDDGWDDVYVHIKLAAEKYQRIKALRVNEDFKKFLNDATLLTKAHPAKNSLLLSDIFVDQELTIIDNKENEKRTTVLKALQDFKIGSKYVISGDDQSGKTTILRKAFDELRKRQLMPIYIKDTNADLKGNLHHRVAEQFKIEYDASEISIDDIDKDRIVLLIDDFHRAKNIEKLLHDISEYKSCILVVDEIFCLDVRNGQLVLDFNCYRIRELKASLRDRLIRNWLSVREDNLKPFNNAELARIDELTSLVEQSLGKAFGNGIMPAHPFFILHVLCTYDIELQPGNSPHITSQGHCYQALIYFFLRSNGVDNDKVDGYLNFFTEFAMTIYRNGGAELNPDEFQRFFKEYEQQFNFVEDKGIFRKKVLSTGILTISSFTNISFSYPYLYYYFAGKYFADHLNDPDSEENKVVSDEVKKILKNLHKTSNAYIAIFIVHHTKRLSLLNDIQEVANEIYAKYSPATLAPESLYVFGRQNCVLPEPSLPADNNAEARRSELLEIKDKKEELQLNEDDDEESDDTDEYVKELRRSIKTVEVIGAIIKNRAGSIANDQLKKLFVAGMDVHLRQITSFLEIVEEVTKEPNYSDFLMERIKNRFPNVNQQKLKSLSNQIFWGLNYAIIISVIIRISKSLGTDKLINLMEDVCDQRNTASSYMVKHTILMWIKKNLRFKELENMNKVLKSPVAQRIMRLLITDFCMMHHVGYKDSAKLVKLGINPTKLLPHSYKGRN